MVISNFRRTSPLSFNETIISASPETVSGSVMLPLKEPLFLTFSHSAETENPLSVSSSSRIVTGADGESVPAVQFIITVSPFLNCDVQNPSTEVYPSAYHDDAPNVRKCCRFLQWIFPVHKATYAALRLNLYMYLYS